MSQLKSINVNIGAPYGRPGIDIYFSVGFCVSIKEKNKIDLFSIDKKNFNHFIYNAPTICQKIIEQIGLGISIHDVEWTYTAAPVCSKLEFEALNGLAVKMKFDNGEVANTYFGNQPLDYYEKALNDSREFKVVLQEKFPNSLINTYEPIIKYLAHTPGLSKKIHFLERPYKNLPFSDYPVVLIDTKSFIDYWKYQCGFYMLQRIKTLFRGKVNSVSIKDDDRELLKSSKKTSSKYIIPREMANVGYININIENRLRFTNGRHRVVNLANAGAPFIPIQTTKEELKAIRELFEWEPAKNFNPNYQ